MIVYILLFVLFLLLVKGFFAFTKFHYIQAKLSSIPGPQCELLNGNLNLFYKQSKVLSSEIFYDTLKAIAQVYHNEGIFKLRFGNKFIVCVFQSQHLKSIAMSVANIDKSVEYNFLNEWLGNGLLLASNKNWFHRRTLLAKAFHKENMQEFAAVLNHKTDLFLSKMVHQGYLSCDKTFQFTVDAIAGTLLRCQMSEKENQSYLTCIHQMTHSFTERALNYLLWNDYIFKLTAVGKTYYDNLQILKRITKKMTKKRHCDLRENQRETYSKPNLLELLLPKTASLDEHFLDQICKEVDTFLFAGHDTAALSINWILYHLGLCSEEQIILREEIDAELDTSQAVQFNQLDRLVCMDRFINECLRLHPPVPLIGRQISKEFSIGMHTIPKDTMVYILIDQLHLDERCFPSPHEFVPTRFIERPAALSYMPFSAGPRNCIGKRFALVLIKVLLVKVLRRFVIHSEEKIDQIELTYNIVLKPKRPLKVRLTEIGQLHE